MDLKAQGSQVKSELGSAMQKHIPAGGRYFGELLCEPLFFLFWLAECSEVSHLVQMLLCHGFRALWCEFASMV